MYTLYYSPGACSMAVHAVLNEIGAEFELKKESLANPSSEFKKANPRGQVPTLVDDGFILREGAAILIHLAENANSPLLPREGKARAAALEWLMFANSTLHPAYGKLFGLMKQGGKEKYPEIFADTSQRIQKHWDSVEEQLGTHAYIAGEQVTLADFLLTVIANWISVLDPKAKYGPRTQKLFQNVKARPSFQKTLATENVQYEAAA